MQTYSIFFFLMISFVHLGHAQKKQAWVKAAHHAFAVEEDYYKAYRYYEAALKYQKDTSDVLHLLYRKAEAARLINAYVEAHAAYLELVNRAPADSIAQSPYRCALAYLGDLQLSLAYSGNELFNPAPYKKALTYFAAYDSLAPAAPGHCDGRVTQGRALIQFATQGKGENLINEEIKVEKARRNLNSGFSDFAPMPWGDQLYFTSIRQEIRGKGEQPARFFSRIYRSKQGKPAEVLPIANLTPKDTFHVGHTTFNHGRDRMYFTRCEYVNGTLNTRCDLYYHQLDSQGNPIGNPVEVVALNQKNSTLTQPALGWDPDTEREVLFFASNRAGTRGKMDIWKSELVDGRFTSPTNDLVINTKGNEISPFYQNGQLFFSSDGQQDRYGGYDIFYTSDLQTGDPVNLGQKINSSADEMYYSRNEESNLAYFSSNRLATTTLGMANDLKTSGSLDIFYYPILELPCPLEVSAFLLCGGPGDDGRQLVDSVSIALFDITDGVDVEGKKGIELAFQGQNRYRLDNILRPGRKYLLIGTREGFDVQRQVLDFTGNRKPCANGAEKLEFYFRCDKALLQVQVYHHNRAVRKAAVRIVPMPDSSQNLGISPAQRAVDGAQIPCPEEEINLYMSYPGEKKIKSFSEEIPLEFGQTYLIIADPGLADTLLFSSTTYGASRNSSVFCEASCRDTLRIDLEALPSIQLFFENGVPGPHPYDVSGSSYLTTLDRYLNRQGAYLEQISAESGSELDLAQRVEIEQFFGEKLNQSFPAFYQFMQQATALLCQNVPIIIEAKACTTPKFIAQTRKQEEYMRHLANRRIESVQQDLIGFGLSAERWRNLYRFKALAQACEASSQDSGIVKDEWLEKENARLSPFSIDSAMGRRVELRLKIGIGTEN